MWKTILEIVRYVLYKFGYKKRLESKIDMLSRRIIRLEIIDALKRKDTHTVCALFDEYKELGGNSYISFMVEKYMKSVKRKKK